MSIIFRRQSQVVFWFLSQKCTRRSGGFKSMELRLGGLGRITAGLGNVISHQESPVSR